MTATRKILETVLLARSDANIRFNDLIKLIESLGFDGHIRGDHYIYHRVGVDEIINVQPRKDGKAKPY